MMSEIWFPTDDCAVVTENDEVVEVLENTNDSEDGHQAAARRPTPTWAP